MAALRMFEVICEKFNFVGILTSANYAKEGSLEVYNFN
jgi:hypothetical protein